MPGPWTCETSGRIHLFSCRWRMAEVCELKDLKEVPYGHNDTTMYPELRAAADSGQARLHALGYRQELRRVFTPVTSFSTSLVLMADTAPITGKQGERHWPWYMLLLPSSAQHRFGHASP